MKANETKKFDPEWGGKPRTRDLRGKVKMKLLVQDRRDNAN